MLPVHYNGKDTCQKQQQFATAPQSTGLEKGMLIKERVMVELMKVKSGGGEKKSRRKAVNSE